MKPRVCTGRTPKPLFFLSFSISKLLPVYLTNPTDWFQLIDPNKHTTVMLYAFLQKPIKGTQRHHRFVPVSSSEMSIYPLCLSRPTEGEDYGRRRGAARRLLSSNGDSGRRINVCVREGGQMRVGIVDAFNEELDDFKIRFLRPPGIQGS